jgi:hypothetical protein
MPPRKKTQPDESYEPPTQRACATDEVNERLLRTVAGYAEARSAIEDRTTRMLGIGAAVLRTGCTEIPVVVHVLHRTAAEDISDAQIHSQIDVLNQDYRATNPDKSSTPGVFAPLIGDARITFKLATTDPQGNPTTGITRHSTTNTSFTSNTDNAKHASTGGADAWPADKYLNVWTCGNLRDNMNRALLGYAQFPGGPAATDGVVILHSAFGNTGTAAAPFNLGRTATHEIGHWLNLRHIWGDDGTGCSGSDFVADTPNAAGPNFGKPTFPSVTCGNGPNGDLFMNYMDYTDDDAMFMFTAGQVDRMQAALDGPRSTMGTTGPCPGPKPIKEFVKDTVKDVIKETPKDHIKEVVKERPKDNPKDLVKEPVKETPKDFPKDPFKEIPKEVVKEPTKDHIFDNPLPKHILDPPKGFDPPIPIPGPGPFIPGLPGGPVGPVGAGAPGAMPFVLGAGLGAAKDPCEGCGPQAASYGQAYSGAAAAAPDPLLAVVQQLGGVLAGYYAAASQGRLDAASAQRWQQLAAVYAQIVALLG